MLHVLLYTHIVLMSTSLVATISICAVTAYGKYVSRAILQANVFVTFAGIGCGAALLVSQPLSAQCIMLASYLLGFALAYRFITAKQRKLSRDLAT